MSNGLGSPLCNGAPGGAELSAKSRRDCETSGFVATAAPTGNFGLDVHIDTGVLGLSSGGLLTTVQDLFVAPLWMAVVWTVHALVVMLEWCFTIDLLDSTSVGGAVARGLRQMQSAFTEPWLATVLAVGSVLAAYDGLVRRRVAETVGQALLALAMMAGGIWVMIDPAGTVGALGRWANQASLGTLAVTASGTPGRAGRALAESMGTVFAVAVEVPWCYLEFGDVGWCRSPARLDPRLHGAALKIAAGEVGLVGCRLNSSALSICAAPGSAEARTLEHSAQLLRGARTNGAIFLALPANGPARNAINERESLLRAICQSENATSCRGPTVAQAEFRTNRGTWARVGGLLLIVAGVLGMLLLLGFVALRLLAAALLSLLFLLLAPAAVLAPALGEAGRAVFRRWGAQLLGAVVSKLLFSFLLGAILAILAILSNLEALGWWTEWLLMSAFWWGTFARRHQALAIAGGALGRDQAIPRRTISRRVSEALEAPRMVIGGVHAVKERHAKRAAEVGRRGEPGPAPPGRVATSLRDRAGRSPDTVPRATRSRVTAAPAPATPQAPSRLFATRVQLERVRHHQGRAAAMGDSRRAARLASRAERIEGEIDREERGLRAERRVPGENESDRGERYPDARAAKPARAGMAHALAAGERRDYAALAGLAGYGRREYERLDPAGRRAARLEIDRELASRKGRAEIVRAAPPAQPPAGDRVRPSAGRAPDRPDRAGPSESTVMRDAREVARRRKRQLGTGRP